MTLVVDANVAVKWFVAQQGSDHARRVLAYPRELIAPTLLVGEATTSIWRHVAPGDIDDAQARAAIIHLPRWFNELVDDRLLAAPAMDLAIELNYAPYDLFYLALSIERNAPFVTADRRLVNRLSATKYRSRTVLLQEWTP
jgi:predicted nucleic acid-binding protein